MLAALELVEAIEEPLRLRAGLHVGEAVRHPRRRVRPRRQRGGPHHRGGQGRRGAGLGRRPRGRRARWPAWRSAGPAGSALKGVEPMSLVPGRGRRRDRSPARRTRQALLETIETQRFGCEMAGSAAVRRRPRRGGGRRGAAGAVRSAARARGRRPRSATPCCCACSAPPPARARRPGARSWPRHYPSAGGTPGPGPGAPTLLAAVERPRGRDRACGSPRACRPTRSGAAPRCSAGYLELARLGPPAAGARGGRQRRAEPAVRPVPLRGRRRRRSGPADSPLRVRPARGSVGAPDLAGRAARWPSAGGCDLAPIDAATAEGRLRLRSFVWPDQLDRLARLDGALAAAQADPPVVDQADAGRVAPASSWPSRSPGALHGGDPLDHVPVPAGRGRGPQMLGAIDDAGRAGHAGRAGRLAAAGAGRRPGRAPPHHVARRRPPACWPRSSYHGPPVVVAGPELRRRRSSRRLAARDPGRSGGQVASASAAGRLGGRAEPARASRSRRMARSPPPSATRPKKASSQ